MSEPVAPAARFLETAVASLIELGVLDERIKKESYG